MKTKSFFNKIIKVLNPLPNIGGLEISDSAIRFISLSGAKLKQAAVNLPGGTIIDGQIKKEDVLSSALKNLRRQISFSTKAINVIVTAAAPNIYTQVFSAPVSLEELKLEEAVKLNLEMISPFNIKNAYYDAQRLNERANQIDFLGAFANAAIIDQFTSILGKANFTVVAFEFPALSLSRLIKEEINFYNPHVLLYMSDEGLDFSVLVNGNLYFNHFLTWRSIQQIKPGATMLDIEDIVINELKRLINFYGSRFGNSLDAAVLLFPRPLPDLEKAIGANFPSLKVQTSLLSSLPQVSSLWFPAFGAALRGLVPRSEDKFISLMAVGTEEEYSRNRVINFVRVWRNIVLTALVFLLLLFLAADVILKQFGRSVEKELAQKLARPDVQEIEQLQKEAQEFNRLVKLAGIVQQKTIPWSPFLSYLNKLIGSDVTLERVYVDFQKKATLTGRTSSESAAVNFKNKLLKVKNFEEVTMPLSLLQANADGSVSFTINFVIKNLEF